MAKVIPQQDVGLLGHVFVDDAAICSRIHQEIQMVGIKVPHKCARKHLLLVFPDEEQEASAFVSPTAYTGELILLGRIGGDAMAGLSTIQKKPCRKSSVS